MKTNSRSPGEILFISLFIPFIVGFYLIYKYPTWFVAQEDVEATFYWFNKSTSFWYSTVYTFFVVYIAIAQLVKNKSPYSSDKSQPLSNYQKWKWTSIAASQFIFFYFVPFIVPHIVNGTAFFNDSYAPVNKNAYVYLYNGFTSIGGFLYIFVLIPFIVWIFGKRYCSWFCACGNLAETAGVTKLGSRWVKNYTPRGKTAKALEFMQFVVMAFAVFFGLLLFFDAWKIVTAPNLVESFRAFQDFAVDLIFGAIIGVGAYPFFGTRIWCRYGCPLAQFMKLFGQFTRSKFAVVANDKCKGLNLCSSVCPMGIDVASYAHKDKVPIEGSFGLHDSPCIGCGGCVDICPVKALSFQKILNPKQKSIGA